MTVKVLKPGIATIQDLGRPGYFYLGIPMSGAMDRFALRCANLLVGNDEGAAGLECTFLGPELEFSEDCVIAVTGAELPPKIDGQDQATWTTLPVKKGQVLSFDFVRSGARAYIAFAGGIDVPLELGSRSTYGIGTMGGLNGGPLQAGDVLPIGKDAKSVAVGTTIAPDLRRAPSGKVVELRVLPGLYWHRITDAAGERFFSDIWTVGNECDRIGYRFKGGTQLEFVEREQPFGAGSNPSNIVDAPYAYGSIQVPNGKEPIVLHRDAVSGGGFFTVGAVISADMDLIGQLQPNMEAQFVKVDMDQALAARADYAATMDKVREAF